MLAACAHQSGSVEELSPEDRAQLIASTEATRTAAPEDRQRAASQAAVDSARATLDRLDVDDATKAAMLAQLQAASAAWLANATPEVEAPRSPAGAQLDWFLHTLNDRRGALPPDEAAQHFSGAFLQQVPPSQLAALFAQLAEGLAPLRLESVTERSPLALLAQLRTRQGPARVRLSVDAAAPHKLEGLLIQPGTATEPPQSWEALKTSLAAMGTRSALLAARLEGDRCVPLQAVHPTDALAVGSTFKLYVLLAVAKQVEAGALAWSMPVTVREVWKSWPSGTLQDEPAGTQLPLREVAQRMIAISDNTAADHLIHTVGRAAVERALTQAHHATPALNLPFLTTRELFALKLDTTEAQRAAYLRLSPAQRRAYLARLDARPLPPLASASGWKEPIAIDSLEWFASPADLCQAMAALKDAGGSAPDAPPLAILGKNPGVAVDRSVWSYVGFKGGSEPGVINLTFLLQRRSDRAWFVFTLTVNDTRRELDQGQVVSLAEGALQLLGR